jgi:hypothetical protein
MSSEKRKKSMSKKKETEDDKRFTAEVGQTFLDAGLMGGEHAVEAAPDASDAKPDAQPVDDLQTRFDALTKRMARIIKSRTRLGKMQNIVDQKEQAKKTADAELKAAVGDRDKATIELERVIDDDKAGQAPLPGVEEQLEADEPVASGAAEWPITVLGSKELAAVVGDDVISRQKEIEDPIGLTEAQLEKLESACESTTVAGLEKWIAGDSWWHQKIKGFGDKAIQRVVSTLVAFRAVHPMQQAEAEVEEKPPTILESLAEKNDAAKTEEPATETAA